MANNYLRFSEAIVCADAELDWCFKNIDAYRVDDDEGSLGAFSYGNEGKTLYIYAEEYGDVGAAADFIQQFLVEWRPKSKFKIEWAETCSSPRPGEFGGGAVVITATSMEWLNTRQWVEARL